MEILARASLKYNNGESISSGWEGLHLVVKFKEDKKLLKTRLVKTLASTFNVVNAHLVPDEKDRYKSFDEYYNEVEWLLKDKNTITRIVEDMVKDYFNKKNKNDLRNNRSKAAEKLANNSPKIEVKVKL